MTPARRSALTRLSVAMCLGISAAACNPLGGKDAHIVVVAETTGMNIDPDGYSVYVDTIGPKRLAANGQVDIVVSAGDHIVLVNDVAGNCGGAADTTQKTSFSAGVSLFSGNTVRMTLAIVCK